MNSTQCTPGEICERCKNSFLRLTSTPCPRFNLHDYTKLFFPGEENSQQVVKGPVTEIVQMKSIHTYVTRRLRI